MAIDKVQDGTRVKGKGQRPRVKGKTQKRCARARDKVKEKGHSERRRDK